MERNRKDRSLECLGSDHLSTSGPLKEFFFTLSSGVGVALLLHWVMGDSLPCIHDQKHWLGKRRHDQGWKYTSLRQQNRVGFMHQALQQTVLSLFVLTTRHHKVKMDTDIFSNRFYDLAKASKA